MSVKRVYVEKKAPFAVRAQELKEEIGSYLGIDAVTGVRVLIRYDIEKDVYKRQPMLCIISRTVVSSYPFSKKSFNETSNIFWTVSSGYLLRGKVSPPIYMHFTRIYYHVECMYVKAFILSYNFLYKKILSIPEAFV